MKYMPRNVIPPEIIKYGATDVPVIQLSVSSSTLADTKAYDFSQNIIRPGLAVVQGASVPRRMAANPASSWWIRYRSAASARHVPRRCNAAIQFRTSSRRRVTRKSVATINVLLNNSTRTIAALNDFPIKRTHGTPSFCMTSPTFMTAFRRRRMPSMSMDGRKFDGGPQGRRRFELVDRGHIKDLLPDLRRRFPKGMEIQARFDQSIFVKAALNSVLIGGGLAAGLTAPHDPAVPRQLAAHPDHPRLHPALNCNVLLFLYTDGQTLNTMTLGGFRWPSVFLSITQPSSLKTSSVICRWGLS